MSRADALFASLRAERQAQEQRRALDLKRADELRERSFLQQRWLVEDTSRWKVALCSRRAGKTTGVLTLIVDTALRKVGANILYLTLTRKKAKAEIWPPLKRLLREFSIDYEGNETDLTVRLPNGSLITLGGAQDAAEIEKWRGSDDGYDLVVIDECKSYSPGLLDVLVNEIIVPTLGDRMGSLVVIGTPGQFLQGLFYQSTGPGATLISEGEAMTCPYADRTDPKWNNVAYAWSGHRWLTKDNVAKPNIWQDQLLTKKRNRWTDDDPRWRREYMAEWVSDSSRYVYKYVPERNDWDGRGDGPWGLEAGHDWHYLLGADLGYEDEFTIVVAAWAETSPNLYYIDEFHKPYLDLFDNAARIQEFVEKYGGFDRMVVDGANKTAVVTLRNRFGLDLEAADKTRSGIHKRDSVEPMNSDFLSGRIKVKKGMALAGQWASLQWAEDGKNYITSKDVKDDLADAGLYIHQYALHNYFTPPPPEPTREAKLVLEERDRAERLGRDYANKARERAEDIRDLTNGMRMDRLDHDDF